MYPPGAVKRHFVQCSHISLVCHPVVYDSHCRALAVIHEEPTQNYTAHNYDRKVLWRVNNLFSRALHKALNYSIFHSLNLRRTQVELYTFETYHQTGRERKIFSNPSVFLPTTGAKLKVQNCGQEPCHHSMLAESQATWLPTLTLVAPLESAIDFKSAAFS